MGARRRMKIIRLTISSFLLLLIINVSQLISASLLRKAPLSHDCSRSASLYEDQIAVDLTINAITNNNTTATTTGPPQTPTDSAFHRSSSLVSPQLV